MKNYIGYHNVSHKIFHNKLTFVVGLLRLPLLPLLWFVG